MKRSHSILLVLVAGAALAAPPAGADLLVTREGAKLEIKGPWTVKGKIVTFTLPNGTLGSMRLGEVDLEASAAATAAAVAATSPPEAAAAPAAPPKAVLVLTDADVAHAGDTPSAAAATAESGGATPAAAAAAAAPAGNAITVSAWDKAFSEVDNGVAVTGTVRNGGRTVAAGVTVNVRLYDEEGKLSGTAPATLSSETLEPGGAARFRAVFPGVVAFSAARFEVDSTPIAKGDSKEPEPPPGS